MASILIVDDEQNTCDALAVILRREGHTVTIAVSGDVALSSLQDFAADLVLSDVRMPGMDGLSLLSRLKSHYPSLPVVMMSGHSDVTAAVEAMKQGAFDYLVKPFGKEDVLRAVQKALTMRAVLVENLALRRQVQNHSARARLVGGSAAWRQVCAMVDQVAPSRATVLLTGESGTGKELVAGLLHRLSPRAERPFITLNAAALPDTLLEAELFGYEKGAFTGALQRKPGRFELADGGTLFLDEIGEMPLGAQTKLLRVLQEGTFERLGGTRTLRVDVRIIAATNKALEKEVAAQRFRADLYYRINVIAIQLPALRERREDIPLLVAHFLRHYARENDKTLTNVHPHALQRLQMYDWPGNVRELENVIERAVVLASGPTIGVADLPPHFHPKPSPHGAHEYFMLPGTATLAQIERAAIVQALQRHAGNRQAVARTLDIGVATLYRKLKEYQLQ
jgi:two-component system response regulator HydG